MTEFSSALCNRVRQALIIFIVLLHANVHAITVNRLNGGGSISYVDFSIPGDVVPLELSRTYNSITAISENSGWSGIFGWGWTSDVETTLTVTPERYVLLRDGMTGNNVLFKPPKENSKAIPAYITRVKTAYFLYNKSRQPRPEELKTFKLPGDMEARLKTDPMFRFEIARRYGVKGEIPKEGLLISSTYGYETMQFKNNQWIRSKDGVRYYFDKRGRLTKKEDKNGFYLDFKYFPTNKLQLMEISTRNKTASLRFAWRKNRVVRVTDNRGLQSSYKYDDKGNLIEITDSNKQTYVYKYENEKFPHILTKILYPSEKQKGKTPSRLISYDKNGLLVRHKDKTGSETRFIYGKSPNDPENNFWTRTIYLKKKDASSPDERFEEFSLKKRPDGSKYLYKQVTNEIFRRGKSRKAVKEVTLFTSCCGKPAQIVKNGVKTKFKYFENGLLKERISPKEELQLAYHPVFQKVTKVARNGFVSNYEYDKKGNLVKATNSRKQRITLQYDSIGRISAMVEPSGKKIAFEYGKFGKPVKISQAGVGTILISYDASGKIKKTETFIDSKKNRRPTTAESQRVVRKVMGGFQKLLNIIRPAAEVNKGLGGIGTSGL